MRITVTGRMRRRIAIALVAVFLFGGAPRSAAAFTPNDPGFVEQWYLRSIRAPAAWDYTFGAPGVTVALLDTGVQLSHPDLVRSIWYNVPEQLNGIDDDGNGFVDDLRGWNFVDDVGDPQPRFSSAFLSAGVNHGTVIAGELVGRGGDGYGIAGLAWRVRLMPVRVLSSEGRGGEENVIRGIDYAIKNGADIISMSFVTTPSLPLRAAIRRAYDAGVLVVAAAGLQLHNTDRPNVGPDLDKLPGDPVCADIGGGQNIVVGVGSTDENDRLSGSSGYGSCIDILAPGEQIYSTQVVDPAHGFSNAHGGGWVGPSLAAPLVAGAAALIKSAKPSLTVAELRDILITSADNVDGQNMALQGKLGHGRLNLVRAFERLGVPKQSPAAIVVARGPGAPPELRILSQRGDVLRTFFAYDPAFKGGVAVATGDLDGNGHDEIITVPASGGSPHVRIFDAQGSLVTDFMGGKEAERGGYSIAAGDLDGDGRSEIVLARGSGSPPEVRIFEWTGALRKSFLAYDKKFTGGVSLAVGDLDGDGRSEIITAPASRGGPHVKVWNRFGFIRSEFFAGSASFTRGLDVTVADRNGDGQGEILVHRSGDKKIIAYDVSGISGQAFDLPRAASSVSLGSGDVAREGTDAVVATLAIGRTQTVLLMGRSGELLRTAPFPTASPLRAALLLYP